MNAILTTEKLKDMKTADEATRHPHFRSDVWPLATTLGLWAFASGLIQAFVLVAMRRLGASFTEIGIVAAFYNLALALASFFGGSLTTRFGGKKIFITSMFLGLAAMLLYGTAALLATWAPIAMGLLLARITQGFKDTSSFTIVSGSADGGKKATSFGVVYTFSFAGSVLAAAASGVVVFYYGYSVLFLSTMPIMTAAILTALFKLRKEDVTAKKSLPSWTEMKEAFASDKSIMFLLMIAVWEQFFAEFGNPYYFIYMQENLKAPDYLLPLPQVAFAASSLITGAVAGRLSDAVGRRKPFIVAAALLNGIGSGMVAFATSAYVMVGTYFIFGISNVLAFMCLQAYFSDVGGSKGHLIWGAYLALLWSGGIFPPFIAGVVAEQSSLQISFIIVTAGMLAEAAMLLIFFKEKRASPQ